MSWLVHVVVLAALAGCTAPMHPESDGNGSGAAVIAPAFARAELSGDGVVSAEEWTTDSMVLFDQLDRDHDQEIEAIELRDSFAILDLDRDGAIELEEAGELVERGDADGDGRLSPAEFEQLKWERLSADLNRDGLISREEFSFTRNQLFLASDRNRDRRLNHREIDPVRFTAFRF